MLSGIVLQHFQNPHNEGSLPGASAVGVAGSERERFMRIELLLEGDRIREARFRTYACAAAIATGSLLTEWLGDRPVEEALKLEPETLDRMLGGVPRHRYQCVVLAVAALRAALAEARRCPP